METISFATDAISTELVETEELADCAATAIEREEDSILSYGTGAGYTPLRELLARRYSVHPYRVILTNGWFQGLVMLTAKRALRKDVGMEYPTYAPALEQFASLGADIRYISRRDEGLFLAEMRGVMKKTMKGVSYIYTIPSFQNPTGESLSGKTRWEMWKMAWAFKTPIIEDDTYGLLRFEGDHIPTIFELGGGHSIYSTSFSYTAGPGLRVGVFIVPDELAGELTSVANASYISPSLVSQATVFEYIQRGSFDRHVLELREALRERRDVMIAALERYLPDLEWTPPEGGIYLMASLQPGTSAKELLASAQGVSVLPGPDFLSVPYVMRLNFAEPALADIEPGIERLAEALAGRERE